MDDGDDPGGQNPINVWRTWYEKMLPSGITRGLRNLPIMLTMNPDHLDITVDNNDNQFKAMFRSDSDSLNMSTNIKTKNFSLEAKFESIQDSERNLKLNFDQDTQQLSFKYHKNDNYQKNFDLKVNTQGDRQFITGNIFGYHFGVWYNHIPDGQTAADV